MKKSSKSSLKKKGLLIYLSSIKTKLAINFPKKKLLHLAKKRAGVERANGTSAPLALISALVHEHTTCCLRVNEVCILIKITLKLEET